MGGLLMSIGSKDELSEECLLRLAHDKLEADYAELKIQRDTLHESNNRQSDIIYDLKVQRDELINHAEWIISEVDRQREGEGGDLRTIKHFTEQLLDQIKEGKK